MTDHARDVRWGLTDPRKLCESLGLTKGAKRQSRGLLICCPVHGERNPSCSVTLGSDGTIRVKCFGCDFAGDALTIIAHMHGLSMGREDFGEVLAIGAELGGNLGLADEIRGKRERRARKPIPPPTPIREPEYPDNAELLELWRGCGNPAADGRVARMLVGRGIDPSAVASQRLAGALLDSQDLPPWAVYGRLTWRDSGHRLMLPAFDSAGNLRSVRAWRVTEGDSPKRLPPSGKKAAELVQANLLALGMLRRHVCPVRLWIVEGEPDYLTTATTFGSGDAVIGIGSGSWTKKFARRVPLGTRVYVSTHADDAGDRYAAQIIETLTERHSTWRWRMTG